MNTKILCLLLLILFASSCTRHTPKLVGHPHIEKVNVDYMPYKGKNISFLLSGAATVSHIPSPDNAPDSEWFNILYPEYNVTIACSYLPITKESFRGALDDNYRLVYSHTVMAMEIDQSLYTNEEHGTAGIIYDIKGQVATPIQFFATDSISNFFRGSLYYGDQASPHYVKTVTEYLKEDIVKLMESLEWKK